MGAIMILFSRFKVPIFPDSKSFAISFISIPISKGRGEYVLTPSGCQEKMGTGKLRRLSPFPLLFLFLEKSMGNHIPDQGVHPGRAYHFHGLHIPLVIDPVSDI